MFLPVFLAGLAAGACILAAGLLVLWFQKRQLKALFKAFFEAPDKETPSQFAVTVDACSRVLATRLINQAVATFRGMNGIDNKIAKREAVQEAISSSTVLEGLAGVLPKRWMNNPAVLALASQLFRGKGNGAGTVKAPDIQEFPL